MANKNISNTKHSSNCNQLLITNYYNWHVYSSAVNLKFITSGNPYN